LQQIYPIFEQQIGRRRKEKLLGQRGLVLWLTGLSGAGKSTIAIALEKELYKKGYITMLLDGDNIRNGLSKDLSFTPKDREENTRRASEIAKIAMHNGLITICCFVSGTHKTRRMVKRIIGPKNYHEVYVNTPIEVCEERDTKGLYSKARKGYIHHFTGVNSKFEIPEHPDIVLKTEELTIKDCVKILIEYLEPRIILPK
jgi:adenylylsulfate kinase